jgi:hypothetical protein
MSDKSKPVHTIRIGAIQAAIWSNPGQHGPFYNVTIERRFKDQTDNWQSSASFARDDCLVVSKLADLAHTYICDRLTAERSKEGDPPENSDAGPQTTVADNGKRRSR